MILETIRIVSDGLVDKVYGVNAKLPGIPIDAGDQRPPDVKTVLDITRHGQAVLLQKTMSEVGADWPIIAVLCDEAATWDGEVGTTIRDAKRFVLLIFYIARDNNEALTVQDASYTLRAIIRTLRELERNANAAPRLRNSVALIALKNITTSLLSVKLKGGSIIAGGLRVEAFVRDMAP